MTDPIVPEHDGSSSFWRTRRPGWLLVALGLTLLSLLSVSTLRVETSLEGLFARRDAAAQAMAAITRDFPVTDSLVIVVGLAEPAKIPQSSAQDMARRAAALAAFGEALSDAVAQDEALSSQIVSLSYELPPAAADFVEQVMLPRLPDYLNDAQLESLEAKLSREGMADALARTERMLAAPGAGGVLARELARDPLSLRELALPMIASLQPPVTIHRAADDASPAIINHHATRMLITIRGRRPVSDLAYAADITQRMTQLASQTNDRMAGRFTLAYTGGYAIAAHAQQAIRSDMIASTLASIVFIGLLFLVVFRHPLYLALALGPVTAGILWGFGAYATTGRGLTPPMAVAGAMLAGLGIDYALHLLAHSDVRGRIAQPIIKAMAAAFLTTLAAFGVILFSDVPAMRQFGLLGMLGLTCSLLACFMVLPGALRLLRPRQRDVHEKLPLLRVRVDAMGAVKAVARHARAVLASGLIGFALLVAIVCVHSGRTGVVLPVHGDQRDMHPQPNPPLETQRMIERSFGLPPEVLMVHLQADSPDAMLSLAHRIRARLLSLPADAGVVHVTSLADLLPDPAASSRPARLANLSPARVARDFDAAVAQSNFHAEALASYRSGLLAMLQPHEPVHISTLAQRWPSLTESLLPRDADAAAAGDRPAPSQSVMYIWLDHSLDDSRRRADTIALLRQAMQALPGQRATLTGTAVLAHDTQAMVRRELAWLGLLACAAVLVMLLVILRPLRLLPVALLPLAGSIVFMLAWVHVSGQRLNLINLISLPLILGIAVDYGIFLVMGAPGHDDDATLRIFSDNVHASTLCCLTTMIGFGSVITVSMPALASLGWLLVVGMAGALAGAWLVAIPWLMLRRSKMVRDAISATEVAR